MLWQANPTIEALSSYPLTKLQIEIFVNKCAKIEKGLFVAQQNQDHCTPYMCVMTLLDSRVGRSQFRSRKEVQCGTLLYTASMNYWVAMPASIHSLIVYQAEKKGLGGAAPKKFCKTTPFTLAINTAYALFGVIKALE